jgi:tRNA (cmo5U34)-methyltransferase
MNKDKDTIFSTHSYTPAPFEFNETVVRVFDDMLNRSIPYYAEILLRQAQLTTCHYQPGTRIYDLGCSHGNFGIKLLNEMASTHFEMIAVDSSRPMLDRYEQRLKKANPTKPDIHLVHDHMQQVEIQHASVVIINFTLQFVPPEDRQSLVQRVFDGLLPGGILLLSEKIIHPAASLNALQQTFYYRFKAENGYSELEISRKRNALENVLIPESIEQHIERLQRSGFSTIDTWLKWFNFASLICQK